MMRPKRDHVTPLLKELHWLPVHARIEYKMIMLTFKCLKNLAPAYLSELIAVYKPPHCLRSENKRLLVTPPAGIFFKKQDIHICCSTLVD